MWPGRCRRRSGSTASMRESLRRFTAASTARRCTCDRSSGWTRCRSGWAPTPSRRASGVPTSRARGCRFSSLKTRPYSAARASTTIPAAAPPTGTTPRVSSFSPAPWRPSCTPASSPPTCFTSTTTRPRWSLRSCAPAPKTRPSRSFPSSSRSTTWSIRGATRSTSSGKRGSIRHSPGRAVRSNSMGISTG